MINELSDALRERRISSRELTNTYLSKIENSDLGAYLTVCGDIALKKADEIDSRIASGEELNILAGIPFALKDNIMTRGIRTTAASKMLEDFIPPYEATASKRLCDCGGVMLGKLNMDEFGMGSSTRNSYFRPTLNPHDKSRVPGGSSGGAAAAVSAGECVYALGSDTGGSVRQPAAFCGCVGLKPTYGRVSRYGLIAFASSLDQVGVLAQNVYDSALVLSAISGRDSRDSTSEGEKEDLTDGIDNEINGLRIGIPDEFFSSDRLDREIKNSVMNAAEEYEKNGAELVRVSFRSLEYALPAYYMISSCEASSNLARYDGVRYGHRAEKFDTIEELFENSRSEGFGEEVKRRIILGTFALSSGYYDEYYKKAVEAKRMISHDFEDIFKRCDIILTPTTPNTAYRFDENPEPIDEYLGDIFTVPASLAGLPALTIPCGMVRGLPVGCQLIGRRFDEKTILCAGHFYEKISLK